jgi:hypothetical protein
MFNKLPVASPSEHLPSVLAISRSFLRGAITQKGLKKFYVSMKTENRKEFVFKIIGGTPRRCFII